MKKVILTSLAAVALCGCGTQLGTKDIGVSGAVLQNGTLIGVSANLSSNVVSAGASYSTGGSTYSGGVTVKQ